MTNSSDRPGLLRTAGLNQDDAELLPHGPDASAAAHTGLWGERDQPRAPGGAHMRGRRGAGEFGASGFVGPGVCGGLGVWCGECAWV